MSSRLRLLVLLTLVASTLVATGTSAAAPAAPSRPIWWLSTGDSYSAGEGVLGNRGDCAESQDAWGPAAAAALEAEEGWQFESVALAACTGHLVEDFYNRRRADRGDLAEWAYEQAQPPDDKFDVITMSFGGNDIGFEDVLSDCVHLPDSVSDVTGDIGLLLPVVGDDCDVAEEQLRRRVDNLFGPPNNCGVTVTRQSTSTYDCALVIDGDRNLTGGMIDFWLTVATDMLHPGGRLVVVGYPRLFAPSKEWGAAEFWRCNGVTRGDANMLGRIADYLDESFETAVERANEQLTDQEIVYVSVLDAFDDHGLCSADPFFNQLLTFTRNVIEINAGGVIYRATEIRWGGAFHPTRTGQDAERRLVVAALSGNPPNTSAKASTPSPTTRTTGQLPDRAKQFCDTIAAEQARILGLLELSQAEAEELQLQGQSWLAVLTSLNGIDIALTELLTYVRRANEVAPAGLEGDLGSIVEAFEIADDISGVGVLGAFGVSSELERVHEYALNKCGQGF